MLPLTKVEQFTRRHLRHNVIVNLLDGGFFGGAIGFASFSTILPLFVASMTDSATLIGLVPAIHASGWLLPQLFTANYIARLRRYKRTVLFGTIHERIPFLGLALVALLLPKIGLQAGLGLTFLFLIWQGLGGGFTANPWTSMISKLMPPEARGTFFGTQAALANLFISAAAVGAGYLLNWYDSSLDFVACFLIASVFFTISWFFLALTREPADYEKVIEENPPPFWQGAARILQRDKNFSWFLTARILSQFGTMGFAFYIVYALRHFQMDEVTAGYLTAALTISQMVANASMGWLGDRVGHRMVLSHFRPLGIRQCFYLDQRHDHDRRLQRRERTTVLYRPGPNPHGAGYDHRATHRRLDRRYSGLHDHLWMVYHLIHCDGPNPSLSRERTA
jgi:MFS family permease